MIDELDEWERQLSIANDNKVYKYRYKCLAIDKKRLAPKESLSYLKTDLVYLMLLYRAMRNGSG